MTTDGTPGAAESYLRATGIAIRANLGVAAIILTFGLVFGLPAWLTLGFPAFGLLMVLYLWRARPRIAAHIRQRHANSD